MMILRRWLVGSVAAVATGLMTIIAVPTQASAATVGIGGGFQTRATGSGQGGIYTPHVTVREGCEAWGRIQVESFGWTISRGAAVVMRGSGEFTLVRLEPGTYRVQSTATVLDAGRRSTISKTQTITVTRKTDKTSVSSAEYKRIKKGMKLSKVRKIIGGRGTYDHGYLFIDSTKFDHGVAVRFSKGRVAEKYRSKQVYDWC